MAKVLQNFLIGVGLDTEKYDKGAKNVESSLGRMRSLVGLTGAAITGAFAAVGAGAITAGKRVDNMALATEGLKTPIQYVYAYGRALAAMNGNAEDALSTIRDIETAQADLKIEGKLGQLEGVALARGDINALMQTGNGAEFLRTLAPMIQRMNKDQQRYVQKTLGLTDGVMRSLRDGVERLDQAVARASALAGNINGAIAASREFNKELAEFDTRLENVGHTLAEKVLPGFTDILKSMNGFIDRNKGAIDSVADVAAKSPVGGALVTGSAGAAAAGAGLRAVGWGGLGKGLMRLSPYGLAIGSGMLAWDATPEDIEGLTGYKPPSYLFEKTPMDAAEDGWEYLKSRDWWPRTREDANPRGNASGGAGILPLGQLNIHDTDPIYAGGEVSHAEAASASPDVIMVRDQRQQAEKPALTPKVTVQNNLTANLSMDGRVLETKITDVVQQRERNMTDDIASTVDR